MTAWIGVVFMWLIVLLVFFVAIGWAIETGNWFVYFLVAVLFLLITLYWTFAIARRRKDGFRKGEKLINHLKDMGVRASWAEKGMKESKIGASDILGRRSEGLIKIEGKNFDFISIMSAWVGSGWDKGVNYYFDYLIRDPRAKLARWQKLEHGVFIIPEPRYGYIKVRTRDTLPSANDLKALDDLAGRIKEGTI